MWQQGPSDPQVGCQQQQYGMRVIHPPALGSQGHGERAEEQLVRALQQDGGWGDMAFICANTRWPPRLEEAMENFLAIKPAPAGQG